MFKTLVELYSLLTREQRRAFMRLQLLVIAMAIFEVLSVMSIGPFMGLVADPKQIETSVYLQTVYRWTGVESHQTFLIALGGISVCLLTVAAVVSIMSVRLLAVYGAQVGAELGNRLFVYFMSQPWLFHAKANSSQHINKIVNECGRIYTGIIHPFVHLNAKMVLAILMSATLFVYNPLIAVAAIVFFAGIYFCLFMLVKQRLTRYGREISSTQSERMRLLNEGFGGIKDTILLDKQDVYAARFAKVSFRSAKALSVTHLLSQLPRYAIEYLAFVSTIILILFLLHTNEDNVGVVMSALAIYALAGLKLLPAFQQVYASMSYIRGNLSAFEVLKEDLNNSRTDNRSSKGEKVGANIVLRDRLELDVVSFRYPGTENPALDRINVDIAANTTVGFAGQSGGGKSTLVDLLLGLLTSDSGSMTVDAQTVDCNNIRQWQRRISYVPQQIYLADTSIRLNVAFGVTEEEVDEERVKGALKKALLDEFVAGLPKGIETRVGERGVQLSGGQRQRIGIARALYRDFDLIVLDEATSALDNISEQAIMDNLQIFKGNKTIILIAHRLSTLKNCDLIFLLEDGKIVDSGSFAELEQRNPLFFGTLEASAESLP